MLSEQEIEKAKSRAWDSLVVLIKDRQQNSRHASPMYGALGHAMRALLIQEESRLLTGARPSAVEAIELALEAGKGVGHA